MSSVWVNDEYTFACSDGNCGRRKHCIRSLFHFADATYKPTIGMDRPSPDLMRVECRSKI